MEAAAVAWSADLFGCPVFCIKSVTDIVDGERPAQARFGAAPGAAHQHAVELRLLPSAAQAQHRLPRRSPPAMACRKSFWRTCTRRRRRCRGWCRASSSSLRASATASFSGPGGGRGRGSGSGRGQLPQQSPSTCPRRSLAALKILNQHLCNNSCWIWRGGGSRMCNPVAGACVAGRCMPACLLQRSRRLHYFLAPTPRPFKLQSLTVHGAAPLPPAAGSHIASQRMQRYHSAPRLFSAQTDTHRCSFAFSQNTRPPQ